MKTIHYVFLGALVVAALVAEFDISSRVKKNAEVAKANTKISETAESAESKQQVSAPVTIENYTADQANKKFVQKFQQESLEIAKIQNNPEAIEKRLKELAKQMKPADVQGLYEIISDDSKDGDQRALAVELLSLKNDTTSLMALQNFVANSTNINGNKWDRKKELETVLRAQAIESIAAYPQKDIAASTLSYLQTKVDEKFLNERIGRASTMLYNDKQGQKTLQQQDDEALQELIQ